MILVDANPYLYCKNIHPKPKVTMPINQEASSSSSYINPTSLKASTSKKPDIKAKVEHKKEW